MDRILDAMMRFTTLCVCLFLCALSVGMLAGTFALLWLGAIKPLAAAIFG